jgi:hypothetical protein
MMMTYVLILVSSQVHGNWRATSCVLPDVSETPTPPPPIPQPIATPRTLLVQLALPRLRITAKIAIFAHHCQETFIFL